MALPQTHSSFLFFPLRICYLDESGTPELTGGTSHFVLLGVSISGETWKEKDRQISRIKQRFGLADAEIHAGWLARRYVEQEKIKDFEKLSEADRRNEVRKARNAFLVSKAAVKGVKSVESDRKNFKKTDAYIHLTRAERLDLLRQVSEAVASWNDCHLFTESSDKTAFKGIAPRTPPFEEAFAQVVSRLHRFLSTQNPREHALLVQDRNEVMAKRLTTLMREFHRQGTRWTTLPLIIETPLFVDSHLTSMVQVADLCAYAVRRFCENGERPLFDIILPRFHSQNGRMVGARHYVGQKPCGCHICLNH